MLLESAFHYVFCQKFLSRLVSFSKSYARKQKWVFFFWTQCTSFYGSIWRFYSTYV